MEWVQTKSNKPVIDHWWQTETGWAIAGNPTGIELMPVKAGSSTKPIPGYQVEILNEAGEAQAPNQQGFVASSARYHQVAYLQSGAITIALKRVILVSSRVTTSLVMVAT
ncbi:propionate-CoA ligase [Vibrio astriarenae]|nr:propionate-CoA ligase [Vibrio sp. C7]